MGDTKISYEAIQPERSLSRGKLRSRKIEPSRNASNNRWQQDILEDVYAGTTLYIRCIVDSAAVRQVGKIAGTGDCKIL